MQIPDDFTPDFTCKSLTGMLCNRNSSLQCVGNSCFISLNNKINIWDLNSTELLGSHGNRSHRVTSFLVDSASLYVGYDDGVVEIIKDLGTTNTSKTLRLHSKRVTGLVSMHDKLISASADGSICCFDLTLEEVQHYFKGSTAPVERLAVLGGLRFSAICADKALKIWNVGVEMLEDAMAFDGPLFDAVFKGDEGLVFMKSGDSYLIGLSDKSRRPFEKFKNIRGVVAKDGTLCVQCQQKTAVFSITKETSLGLQACERFATGADFVSFDLVGKTPCFVTQSGKIVFGGRTYDFSFHENDILDIKTEKSKIYTLSKDKILIWDRVVEDRVGRMDKRSVQALEYELGAENLSSEKLLINSSIPLKDGRCFALFAGHIVVGTGEGVRVFDMKFHELKSTVQVGPVSTMAASADLLAVSTDCTVRFYDTDFVETNSTTVPQAVVYSRFSPVGDIFLCSCLDNKIYQLITSTLELRIVLYGHSLPVRCFSVSPDQKLLVSCGADKLVKVWGFEFGECRKTLVGNSTGVEFVSNSLFVFSDDGLEYYSGFEKLKRFRLFGSGVVCRGSDYLAVSTGRGLAVLSMNKYEFMREEESSEAVGPLSRCVASAEDYDTFLHHIEGLESDFCDASVMHFYEFIGKLEFTELREYLHVLDQVSIGILLRVLVRIVDLNPVIVTRLFIQLVRSQGSTVVGSDVFSEIRSKLIGRIREARDLYNTNLAQLETEINGFTIE